MQPDDLIKKFDVSRETMDSLQVYCDLLHKWQKAINLVSPSTLPDTWQRHFADSTQLAQYIPDGTKTVADIGSGAGFPGLVLAIIRPDVTVHLVESDERKAQFLRTVSRETGIDAFVHAARIEVVTGDIAPDLITARALASLHELFAYCMPWVQSNKDLNMLFLKGRRADEEIAQAHETYEFTLDKHDSMTDAEATILYIKDVQLRT